MKLESSQLYVISVDLELMPIHIQNVPIIISLHAIIASSAGNVQYVKKKYQTNLKLKL